MHFDGNKWCVLREEWLKSQKPVEVKPDATSETIAQLLMNDLEHNARLEMLEQAIAGLTNQLLQQQEEITNVRNS